MSKIFPIYNFYLNHTPFTNPTCLRLMQEKGIMITKDENDCDVFISGRLNRQLFLKILKYGSKKQYLVWTIEPRFDTHHQKC